MTPLKELVRVQALGPLDEQLALALGRRAGETREEVLLGAALASHAVQVGHICADLRQRSLLTAAEQQITPDLPAPEDWIRLLQSSPLVGDRVDPERPKPLILDAQGRLYLYRYARYQRQLASAIRSRAQRDPLDVSELKPALQRLFANHRGQEGVDLQRLAAIAAVRGHFTLISGGPGTGKTFAVAQVLALLVERALSQGAPPPRIALMAPTGKAAQRLGQSITQSLLQLDISAAVRDNIPTEAVTIHRALGYQKRTPTQFRHDQKNPLTADIVLVDEASMVDLALMAKLMLAVPEQARVILLGDKDQLASVEAGAILGDIYGAEAGYSKDFASQVEALTGERLPKATTGTPASAQALRDSMVHLTQSRRYQGESGIGVLARAVNDGDSDSALSALKRYPDVRLEGLPEATTGRAGVRRVARLPKPLTRQLLTHFDGLAGCTPAEKLELMSRFRVLCAHRRGENGVEAVNGLVEQLLASHGLITPDAESYAGRPILITANDYHLNLFNGDVGIIDTVPGGGGLEAHFEAQPGQTRRLSAARLPPHETVFAMSVHKSQGSEFDEVALLLPRELSPVLTRELIYTAVTRAKQRVTIYSEPAVLRKAISRRIQRTSGLRDELWGER